MSTNIYYQPKPVERKVLPKQLKYILAPKYLGHDGSLSGEFELSQDDTVFLEGVTAGSSDGEIRQAIGCLLECIEKYGQVTVELC